MYLLTRWIKIIISTDLPSILYILFKDLNIYSRRVICSIHTDKFISPKCALQLFTSLNIHYYNMMEEIILSKPERIHVMFMLDMFSVKKKKIQYYWRRKEKKESFFWWSWHWSVLFLYLKMALLVNCLLCD